MVSLSMNGDPCPAVPDGHALRAYFQASRFSKDGTPELSSSSRVGILLGFRI
jgi:hypothetical protein